MKTAEQTLKKIARIYERRYKQRVGKRSLNVTTHLYYNMAGAMIDLGRNGGVVDKVAMKTLKDVHRRIAKIGKLLPLEE